MVKMVKTIKATRELLLENEKQTIDIESSIGLLKFRKLFEKDSELLFKYKDNNVEEYCKYFIINQLKSPEISIETLNMMSTEEISGIVKEYLTKSQLLEYFDFNDEFYADFHKGMLNFIKTRFETTQKIMNKFLMPNAIKTFMNNTFSLSTPSEIIENASQNIMAVVEPQQKIWEEWAEKNENLKEIQEKNQEYLEDALEKYNLTKKEAFDNLKRYHWIISPNMDKKIVYDVVKKILS